MTFSDITNHIDKNLSGSYKVKNEKEVLFVSADNLIKLMKYLNSDKDLMFDLSFFSIK